MLLPRENALAFFPAPRRAGNLSLGPLVIAHVVRLAECGIDITRRVPKDKLFEAAWVLSELKCQVEAEEGKDKFRSSTSTSHSNSFSRFLKRARVGLQELSNAVETVLNDAFETFVKPAADRRSPPKSSPHGLGWPLELAEFLCAEYGWTWATAAQTPVATAFALVAAARQRLGGKSGMDYMERAYAKSLKKC